jgi:hypothetical protein
MTFNKKNGNKTTIFERKPLLTPLYLLFLIFGSYYAPIIDADDKNNFTFYRDIMIAFENSMNSPNNSNAKFYNLFMSYFPDNKINSSTASIAPKANTVTAHATIPAPTAAATKQDLSNPTKLKEFFKKQNALKAAATSGTSSIPPPPEYKPQLPANISSPPLPPKNYIPATYNPIHRDPPIPSITSSAPLKSSLKKVRFDSSSGGAPPNNQYYRPMPYGYNQSYYYNPNYKPTVIDDNKTNLSYIIDVYMELHPGTTMSEEERKGLKCNTKWNAIRKAYADFVGKPYVIPPLYKKYNNKTLKASNDKNINKNNITRKQIQ